MSAPDPAQTRAWVRDVVRSGLLDPEQLVAQVRTALAQDHPRLPAEQTARDWIDQAKQEWYAEAATWPSPTDHERLERAFERLEERGIVVLQGVADHWAAKERLDRGGCRGVAWFTPADVWHAIDEAMLEVNLWHADTANVAPGEQLLTEALAVFAECGLPAHFDEGRIEVTARWRRRPGATRG